MISQKLTNFIKIHYLTVSVLSVSAVHPPLLALAVVAGAVGALDDAGGAAGALLLAEGGRLRKGICQKK